MKSLLTILFIIFISYTFTPCIGYSQDKDTIVSSHSWNLIKEIVSKINDSTSYIDIVKLLGKPYDEFVTPSLTDEYVLYYDVPDDPGFMFWIILETEKKTFLYWSNEKVKK